MAKTDRAVDAAGKVVQQLVGRWRFGVVWDTFEAEYLGELGLIGYSSILWTRVWFATTGGQVLTLKTGNKKACVRKWQELRSKCEAARNR